MEKGTGTILLVEDEPAILEMTRMMLGRLGYDVLAAATPEAALTLARSHDGPIDLLLTDVVMPEMNGRELSQRITALFPGMACLFMSGYTAGVIAQSGMLEKDRHFIRKPFSMKDLAAKVKAVLAGTD